MTLTLIRHQFISTLSLDTPATELEKIGRLMGHSLTTQQLYKWKTGAGNGEEDEKE